MRKLTITILISCLNTIVFAGDTNFVAQFEAIWQTHNATNILIFVEDNVATNASPEVFFARGTVAVTLQAWSTGATNYWEQAIQMLSTNNAYSGIGKTNVLNSIQAAQNIFAGVSTNPPTWRADVHAVIFSLPEAPDLDLLKAIANLPPVEN